MVRNDLKEELEGKDVNEFFLEHRPGIDQPGYRVGKIGEEVVVLNESSGEIMDHFYDDDAPDKEWYSLSLYKPECERYEINKNTGQIRHTKRRKTLALNKINGYYVSSLNSLKVKKSITVYIHICLGYIFIPNLYPDVNYIVDHIDRNKLNNSLNNFRWVDSKISRKNQNRDKDKYRFQYFAYSDREMNNLVYKFDCIGDIILILKLKGISTNHSTINSINRCINSGSNYYKGYYWRKENVILKQYLEHLGYTLRDIDLSDFVYNPIYDIKVNIKLGIFCNKFNVITCGFIGGRYYHIGIGKRNIKYTTSHIIWSTANGCIPVPQGKEIDHINSDSLDNRAENLQLVDNHSENMKNPNTQAKIKATKEAKKTQKN